MRPTHAWYTVAWMAVASVALGGVAADEPKAGDKTAAEQLKGSWRPESVRESGRRLTGADLEAYKGMTLNIQEGKSTLKSADGTVLSACELKLDAGRDPKTFDAKEVEGLGVGRTYKGVWEIKDETLKWCFSTKDRPAGFESKEGADFFLLVLRRLTAAEQLQGSWRPESVTESGRRLTGADLEAYKGMTLNIQEGKSTLKSADGTLLSACELKLDAGRDPKTFDAKVGRGLGGGKDVQGGLGNQRRNSEVVLQHQGPTVGLREQRGADFFLLVLRRAETRRRAIIAGEVATKPSPMPVGHHRRFALKGLRDERRSHLVELPGAR